MTQIKKFQNHAAAFKEHPAFFSIETFKEIPKHAAIPVGLVLGIAAGVAIDKALKKIFKSPAVQGFAGIEMAEKTAKYVIPIVEITGGLLGYIYCTRGQVHEVIKNMALGITGYGAVQLYRNYADPKFLNGVFVFEGLENLPEVPALPSGQLLYLPELSGSMLTPSFEGNETESFAGYEEVQGVEGYEDEIQGVEGYEQEVQPITGYEDEIQGVEGYEDDVQGVEGYEDEVQLITGYEDEIQGVEGYEDDVQGIDGYEDDVQGVDGFGSIPTFD